MHPSLVAVVAGIVLAVPAMVPAGEGAGLVVEKVEPERAGYRAGLRAGDALVGWEHTTGTGSPASGLLATPADLVEVEDVQGPLGPVTLHVARDGHPLAVPTDAGELGLTTRPWLPPRALAAYENGLLQAWEIFDAVHIDTDLVTLSGCDTALGKEMGGEGLMGLTRAFLYAGARSVVASLWRLSDHSTPELMEHFYRHLALGAPKDEALRAAQVEMIRAGGDRAQPWSWAAFELFGD